MDVLHIHYMDMIMKERCINGSQDNGSEVCS